MFESAVVVGETAFALLCVGTAAWLVRQARAAATPGVRALAGAGGAILGFAAAGALQRAGMGAVQAGWLPAQLSDVLTGWWEAVQLLSSLAVFAWLTLSLRHHLPRLRRAEQMLDVLIGRLPEALDVRAAGLSPREQEVLGLIGRGCTSDEDLAEALFIAPSTAATHVQRVLRKTNLHSRWELMLAASDDLDVTPQGRGGARPATVVALGDRAAMRHGTGAAGGTQPTAPIHAAAKAPRAVADHASHLRKRAGR